MKILHVFAGLMLLVLGATASQGQVLFSDQFAPSTAGTDLTVYNPNYVVNTTGSPPMGSPMHVISPTGSGAFLATSETGNNPGQTRTTLSNDPDFTNTGPLGAFDGMGAGTFFAGALFDFDSLQAARSDNHIGIRAPVTGQQPVEFGIESINDGADFRAYAKLGSNATTFSAPLTASDVDANGDILLMVQWQNQTGSFDANNDVLLAINPLVESDLAASGLNTGNAGNYNATVTNNAAVDLMELLVETDNFPGPPGNPLIQGTIESVSFGLTFDDAVPTLYQSQVVPEPHSLAIWALAAIALAGVGLLRQRRKR